MIKDLSDLPQESQTLVYEELGQSVFDGGDPEDRGVAK